MDRNMGLGGKYFNGKAEVFLSQVLLIGLLLAMVLTAIGGIVYLLKHGTHLVDYSIFKGEPSDFKALHTVIASALRGESLGIVQLGVLLMVATPIARVASCVLVFACQKDYLYVGISCVVLMLLLYSLFFGY